MCRVADQAVTAARKRLPDEVREAASALPVTFERWPTDAMLKDPDVESDILGLFVGPPLGEEGTGSMPAQIILFLESIREFVEGDEAGFREEVRITYLHELGHYLGWDEGELAARGLD